MFLWLNEEHKNCKKCINLVQCCPKEVSNGKVIANRLSTQEEIKNCLGYLIKEINIVKPKIIVTLGRTAENELKNLNLHQEIYFIYHPSYIIRKNGNVDLYMKSFEKVFDKLNIFKKQKQSMGLTKWLI